MSEPSPARLLLDHHGGAVDQPGVCAPEDVAALEDRLERRGERYRTLGPLQVDRHERRAGAEAPLDDDRLDEVSLQPWRKRRQPVVQRVGHLVLTRAARSD